MFGQKFQILSPYVQTRSSICGNISNFVWMAHLAKKKPTYHTNQGKNHSPPVVPLWPFLQAMALSLWLPSLALYVGGQFVRLILDSTCSGIVMVRVMSQICNKSMAAPAWSTRVLYHFKLFSHTLTFLKFQKKSQKIRKFERKKESGVKKDGHTWQSNNLKWYSNGHL